MVELESISSKFVSSLKTVVDSNRELNESKIQYNNIITECKAQNYDLLKLYLINGSFDLIESLEKFKLLQICFENNAIEIINLIFDRITDIIKNYDIETIETTNDNNVIELNVFGKEILRIAIQKNQLTIIKLIALKITNFNEIIFDKYETLLSYTCKQKQMNILKYFIEELNIFDEKCLYELNTLEFIKYLIFEESKYYEIWNNNIIIQSAIMKNVIKQIETEIENENEINFDTIYYLIDILNLNFNEISLNKYTFFQQIIILSNNNNKNLNLFYYIIKHKLFDWNHIIEFDWNINQNTSLHIAVKHNLYEIVKILINNNFPIHKKNRDGHTPLFIAAENNFYDIFEYLWNKYILIETINNNNNNNNNNNYMLFIICKNGYNNILNIIIKYYNNIINKYELNKMNCLLIACKFGHFETVKLLIESKADITITDGWNHTCIYYATISKNIELLQYLLNIINNQLLNISLIGNIKLFKEIYKTENNDLIICDALLIVGIYKHYNIINYIINNRKNQIINKERNETLLYIACRENQIDLLKHLLNIESIANTLIDIDTDISTDIGTDINTNINTDINTNINTDFATDINNNDINNTDINTDIDPDIITDINNTDIDIDIDAISDYETLLYRAVLNGNLEIVKILVDFGANINITNHNHWTALRAVLYSINP